MRFKKSEYNIFISQEYVSISSGFITFGIWITCLLFTSSFKFFFGSLPADLLDLGALAVSAITPTIWIGRNKNIVKDFKIFLFGEDQISNLENYFGGVWVGN